MSVLTYRKHESAFVDEGAEIGEGTVIWHFCHIMSGAVIGRYCKIGQNVVISPGKPHWEECENPEERLRVWWRHPGG